jgi:DNA replication protein DnaC/primosomal protein DnaI
MSTQTLGQVEARLVLQRTGIQIADDQKKRPRLHALLAQSWARPNLAEWEAGQGICKVCARGFCRPGEDVLRVVVLGVPMEIATAVCDDCAPVVTEHYKSGERDDFDAEVTLTPNWDEKCPPRFKAALGMDQLPGGVDRDAFAKAVAWRYRPGSGGTCKGLYLLGESGSGKTTAFWGLAKAIERDGTAPLVLTSLELSRQLQEAARDIKAVPHLARCRVLMIDDLGKERATPGAAAMLWEVLDQRYAHGMPVIATSRFGSAELAERFGEASIGQDICRRLFALCDGLKFASPTA